MPRGPGTPGVIAVVALLAASSLLALGMGPVSAFPPGAPHGNSRGSAPESSSAAFAAARASLAAGEGPAALDRSSCWTSVILIARDPGACLVHEWTSAARTQAGAGGWTRLGVPPYFFGGGLTYDAADGYVLEFGGLTVGNVTWTYLHGVWTNISSTAGPAPPTRLFPSLADDPALGAVVLFGGDYVGPGVQGSIAPMLRDTWTFHGGHWANVTSSSGPAPSARWEAGLAYDANDSALVLYGGANNRSAVQNGTWEYVHGTWSNVTVNQTTSPPPGPLPAFAGDLSDGYALWFGGGSASHPTGNATWEFSGNRWKNITANVSIAGGFPIPSLELAMLTTESSPDGVMLYGGIVAASGASTFPTDYRGAWHYVAGVWNFVTGGGPAGAQEGLFSDDPPDMGVIYYGGVDEFNVTIYADTSNLSAGAWKLMDSPSSPTPGVGPMMAYDSTSASVLVFPGGDRNETWTYAGGTWTHHRPTLSPPVRIGGTMIDDPAAGGVLLYGGEYATSTFPAIHYRNDTWLWANGTWTNLTATAHGPSARIVAAGAYDSTLGRPVMFGGLGATRYENETWEFSAGRWTNVTHGATPSARDGVALSDDPSDHGLLAFGGSSGCPRTTDYCNDTWTFDNGSWTKQSPVRSPPVQTLAGLAYDPAFGGEILFGGTGWVTFLSGGSQQALNSTWLYSSGQWTNLTNTLGNRPLPGAAGPNIVYDGADGYLFLLDGGYNNLGFGDWWSLTPAGTGSALSVGTPAASVNPVAANATTSLSVAVGGGSPPYEVTWNGLPPGCASANATTISCTPTSATATVVTVTASDAIGNSVTGAGLTLTVTSSSTGAVVLSAISVTPASSTLHPNESVVLIAHPLNATGHAIAGATFVWSVVSGNVGAFNQTGGGSVRFTAGSTAGTSELEVVASYGGKTATAFANVTVDVASVPPPQGTTTSPSAFPYLDVGIVAAVVVVVAIVVVALMMRRRGTPPTPRPPP